VKQTARSVALEAIRRVTDEGAYSTIVIPGALRRSRLDARDRAFATELAFGTIRHLLAIDWALIAPRAGPSPGCRRAHARCCGSAPTSLFRRGATRSRGETVALAATASVGS
jgi:hypothetical protein